MTENPRRALDTSANKLNDGGVGSSTVANDDIGWAIDQFKKRNTDYAKNRDYFKGKQGNMIDDKTARTIFGSKFKNFCVNFCRPCITAVADRLQVNNFTSPAEEAQRREAEKNKREMDAQPTMTVEEQWGDKTLGDLEAQKQTMAEGAPPSEAAARPPLEGSTPPQGNVPAPSQAGTPPLMTDSERQLQVDELNVQLESVPLLTEEAWTIWEKNRMARRSGQVHQEVLSTGDSYVIVWPDPMGYPTIYPQSAHEIRVDYDKERPGRLKKAGKMWTEDVEIKPGRKEKGVRLTLYYPDRLEKYAAATPDMGAGLKAEDFVPYNDPDATMPGSTLPNDWGRVPVFHFANDADLNEYGVSELRDVLPLQDGMNRTIFDLLVAIETQAFPQRYLLNIQDPREGQQDVELGRDRILALIGATSDGSNAAVGQFPAAELNPLADVINQWSQLIAVTSGIPIHHFLPTLEGPSTPASGESQKTSDVKLNMKVKDRRTSFGDTWSDVMKMAVRIHRQETATEDMLDQIEEQLELDVEWEELRAQGEMDEVNVVEKKVKSLGLPWQHGLKELGYTDDDIEGFEHQKTQNQQSFAPGLQGAPSDDPQADPNALIDKFAEATGLNE